MPTENKDYAQLLENYIPDAKKFVEGEVVKGKIVALHDDHVVVDIGYKSEGLVPKNQFTDISGDLNIAVGDEIEVFVESLEDREGNPRLSHTRAKQSKIWDVLEKAEAEGAILRGKVVEPVKGGLSVDVGLRGFLPRSQIEVRRVKPMEEYVGDEMDFKIISINRRRNNVVLSHRAVIEEEYGEKRREILENLGVGDLIQGKIKNIVGYGAFVDLGGVDGLLHIADMAWKRINHPSEMFKVGDDIEVMALDVDPEAGKVALGYKQKTRDPWEDVDEKFPQGALIKGKVIGLAPYGAFVELEDGIEGLIHVSEMSWTKRVKHPNQVLKEGDEVQAKVLSLDLEHRRISLGLKQTTTNPWDIFAATHKVGERVTGTVRNMTEYGVFLEVEDGIDGMVHVSDLSWTEHVKHPSEILKKGETVEALIIDIDASKQRLALGVKQLLPSAWDQYFDLHKVGDLVKGRVTRLTEYGAFIELIEGVEGLVHVSEISDERIRKSADVLETNQDLEVRILKMNLDEKKIGLSCKNSAVTGKPAMAREGDSRERTPRAPAQPPQSDSRIHLGDVVGGALKSILTRKKEADKKAAQSEAAPEAENDAPPAADDDTPNTEA